MGAGLLPSVAVDKVAGREMRLGGSWSRPERRIDVVYQRWCQNDRWGHRRV